MPRRYREQILEVTKTVTIMEVANAAPNKHPRACEVTVTNIASDCGHPVSLKITHMHKSQGMHQSKTKVQIPEINIVENTWDAITSAPNGTTRTEQEHMTQIERTTVKIPSADTTFNHQGDNVIDLQFTQPVLLEEAHDCRKQCKSSTTGLVQTLYYRPFSEEGALRGSTSVVNVDARPGTAPVHYGAMIGKSHVSD
ncbi:unnamed protein product [Angiostrongylus costaricensis]|uniref:DUF1573 domain-containing protein n=1 Tax=Angiostrongylus costaricensis TaxID=334426 RepID=A0A0R3PPU1_ANGCS|nr:unnamed protein product [Angiostrongylus costaricensis]